MTSADPPEGATARPRGGARARRRARRRAERGRRIAIGVYAAFAIVSTILGFVWGDGVQGAAAAGFLAGAALMVARPAIERRRRLSFAVPPGGAELAALPVACAAAILLIRLAQITAGGDDPPIYLFGAVACWVLSLGAAWALGSRPDPSEPADAAPAERGRTPR